jgi:hypothetical protein
MANVSDEPRSQSARLRPALVTELFARMTEVRIPVMWATDYGDVGQSRSEATLVVSYISYVAHMSQEKGK